ncbi:TSUP family transporter [Pseudopelagicola sp. nBUS_19]|uniref:TSUP family transporter n=1 Tax=unclassified Pseudopelagicola TaxID=2649563 RepID=UPI003EB727B7
MPDIWNGVLAIEGLFWIVGITFVAGMVRGFSGFGTAMIYLPVAGQFLPPVWAVATLAVMDLLGPLPNVPKAIKDAKKADLKRLFGGALLLMPLGIVVLRVADPDVFRCLVSLVALVLLSTLIFGLRYSGKVYPKMVYGIGGVSGFLGGAAGMPGPPVIFFYIATPHRPAVIRANTTLFLLGFDVILITLLALQSMIGIMPLALGVFLTAPNLVGNVVGAAVFRPGHEKSYRAVAYAIIGASAISGIPFPF